MISQIKLRTNMIKWKRRISLMNFGRNWKEVGRMFSKPKKTQSLSSLLWISCEKMSFLITKSFNINTISIISEICFIKTGSWLQVQMYSRVGIKGWWFANHISILDPTKPKICKTSIFHELFFLKYIFKIISADDIRLPICLDLNE